MVILAGSSAVVAPVLLQFLLPLVAGSASLHVDAVRIVLTLLLTQLVPLCFGLGVRHWWPSYAARLEKPANLASALLSLLTVGVTLYAQFGTLLEIRLGAYAGMLALLAASLMVGWAFGWPGRDNRKAMALTTALRNLGVGLVIAAANFADTAAVTAVLSYGVIEILGSVLLAWFWGRQAATSSPE
jgi:BASS family bile acid:Na+ symporter